jgi:spermidine synthase
MEFSSPRRAAVPLLAVGAASLLWQVSAARAILAALQGNELALGLVIGTWLVLLGGAAALAGALARRAMPRRVLALLLALAPLAILASFALLQTVPPALGAGQVAGVGRTLAASAACLAAPCLLLGASFALGARLLRRSEGAATLASSVYVLESLGTVAAGLVFHLTLARASTQIVALIVAALLWLATFAILPPRGRPRRVELGAAVAGAAALAFLIPGLPLPGASMLATRVPGHELLEERPSPHGALTVLRRGDLLLFRVNGQTAFSSQDERQVEADVHLPLLAHPTPRRVMLIGGGLGGGVREALKHPISELDYVELDPALIDLARRWGPRALSRPLDDRRVRVIIGDGRQTVTAARDRYDAILVGLPGPSSAQINRFYTEEFFRAVRRALRPGGLVRVTVEGNEGYVSDQTALAQATVIAALRRELGNAEALPAGSTLIIAGRDGPPSLDLATLRGRLETRRISTTQLGVTELADRVQPFNRELHRERLASVRPLRNTDLHPGAYLHAVLLWVALSSPAVARGLLRLAGAAERCLPLVVGVAFGAPLLWGLIRRRRQVPVGLALALLGLTGLALELCVLIGCQERRGVVYHELGALLTAFMLGLAAGAAAGRRVVARWPRAALALGTATTGVLGIGTLGVLAVSPHLPPTAALLSFLLVLALLGGAVGACYPPAAALLAARHGEAAVARSYAWDLLGAAAGSLLATTIAIPVLGLVGTCLVCAALCLGCAATAWR